MLMTRFRETHCSNVGRDIDWGFSVPSVKSRNWTSNEARLGSFRLSEIHNSLIILTIRRHAVRASDSIVKFRIFVFICILFHDIISISELTASNIRMVVKTKLERIWKKMAVAWFKLVFWHLPGDTTENKETIQSDWSMFRPRFEPSTSRIYVRSFTAWASFFGFFEPKI
jgi:hypothetical protein